MTPTTILIITLHGSVTVAGISVAGGPAAAQPVPPVSSRSGCGLWAGHHALLLTTATAPLPQHWSVITPSVCSLLSLSSLVLEGCSHEGEIGVVVLDQGVRSLKLLYACGLRVRDAVWSDWCQDVTHMLCWLTVTLADAATPQVQCSRSDWCHVVYMHCRLTVTLMLSHLRSNVPGAAGARVAVAAVLLHSSEVGSCLASTPPLPSRLQALGQKLCGGGAGWGLCELIVSSVT